MLCCVVSDMVAYAEFVLYLFYLFSWRPIFIQSFGLLFDPSLLDIFTRFHGIFPISVIGYAV